jgi:peroxiredoxin (alkyl hydroperoxide reductase subunit C)
MCLKVRSVAPDFAADVYERDADKPRRIHLIDFRGKWVVLFFYPRDFTFVCPTEIERFAELEPEFKKEDAVVIGASTDSFYTHKAWYETDERIRKANFPIIADTTLAISRAYGVLNEEDGSAFRATFIIDPDGVVRHVTVNDMDVGRSVDETLRTLRALKTGELCPAEWRPGMKTLGRA